MAFRKKQEIDFNPGPQLSRRRANRQSTIKSGRTIGEKRERMETANERRAKREKDKRKSRIRVISVSVVFALMAACLLAIYFLFFERGNESGLPIATTENNTQTPTIEIVDEDSGKASQGSTENANGENTNSNGENAGSNSEKTGSSDHITSRMREYIAQAEADFRDLGYKPVKAVIPSGSVRVVNFYLDGQSGYVKMWLDRDTAPSVEDADRLIRYLKTQGINEFQYIDVRLPYKAFWK